MCVFSLLKCTQADKDQNNTMCVLSLFKCTQADKGQNNTMWCYHYLSALRQTKIQITQFDVSINEVDSLSSHIPSPHPPILYDLKLYITVLIV